MARLLPACVLVAFLLLPATGVAELEEPPPLAELQQLADLEAKNVEVLRTMLASDDSRTVAWGAYEAGRRRARALIHVLLHLAQHRTLRTKEIDTWALGAVLAALVDLEARAPRELLLKLWRGGRMTTSVILAIENGTKQDLLALWDATSKDGSPYDEERALGNALASRWVGGFARRLLADLKIELHLLVRSDDREAFWRRPSGSVPGDGRYTVPVGYPPIVVHGVTTLSGAGNVVLADGIEPIYRYRWEHKERTIGFGVVHGMPTWQEAHREWLSMLLGYSWRMREVVPPRDMAYAYRWGWKAGYRRWAQEKFDEVHAAYWRLARELIAEKELTREEAAGLVPKIEIRVHDDRTRKTTRLPQLVLTPPPNPFLP